MATLTGISWVTVGSIAEGRSAETLDPYLYYVAGAHGRSHQDGSPIVQFDTQTRPRQLIAFDPAGDRLYITWNISRGSGLGTAWD